MTLGGVFGRVAIQLLYCLLLAPLTGGGLVWVLVAFLAGPAIGISVFVFAPMEYVAARYGVRWLAWIAIPFVGAGSPWLLEFTAPNRANFLAGIWGLCFLFGAVGVLWTLSSLTVLFFQQPILPDKRLFD